MTIRSRLICILFLTIGLNIYIIGQAQIIPESQYNRAEIGAREKGKNDSYRTHRIEKYSKFGKISSEVSYVSEYLPPDPDP